MNPPCVPLLIVVVPVPSAVSAGFRLERRLHRFDRSTQPLEHLCEHVVGGDAQIPRGDFDRHMPVAQMVSGANEVLVRFAGDMQDAFGLGHDLDHPPVACDYKIAAPENLTSRQHKTDLLARGQVSA